MQNEFASDDVAARNAGLHDSLRDTNDAFRGLCDKFSGNAAPESTKRGSVVLRKIAKLICDLNRQCVQVRNAAHFDLFPLLNSISANVFRFTKAREPTVRAAKGFSPPFTRGLLPRPR
jgi:hypothetical protein